MNCSLPGSSVHEISQTRIVEWVAISISRRSCQPREPWQADSLPLSHLGSILYQIRENDQYILLFIHSNHPPNKEFLSFFFFFGFSKQFSSVAQSRRTLCDPMNCSTPGFPVHHQLPEPTQTHLHRVSDAIQPSHSCHPLLLLPSVFPSIRVFSNEYSGLISFRIDWFDLLATLNN